MSVSIRVGIPQHHLGLQEIDINGISPTDWLDRIMRYAGNNAEVYVYLSAPLPVEYRAWLHNYSVAIDCAHTLILETYELYNGQWYNTEIYFL